MAKTTESVAPAASGSALEVRTADGAEAYSDAERIELIGKPLIMRDDEVTEVHHLVAAKHASKHWREVAQKNIQKPMYRQWRNFRTHCKRIVKSSSFNVGCMMVILCSSVLLGLEATVSKETKENDWFYVWSGRIMTALFTLEWTVRFIAGGLSFLREPLNIMFTIVVWAPFLFSAAPQFNSVRVVVRCLRLGKVVNTIKHIRALKTVWLLVTGLFGSAMTLMWSCTLIFLTVFFFSILAVEIVGHSEVWQDAENEQNCPECYWAGRLKTVSSAMFVMTRFMNHDGAMDVLESILTRQKQMWMFFYLFMAISVYVLLNLVTAIIVDRALQIVEQDEEQKAKEAIEQRKREMKALTELFRDLDVDGNGGITKEEFMRAFRIDALQVKLQLMGIQEDQLQDLFNTLNADATDGNDTLDLQEFCKGLPKMFGDAKSYDMLVAQKKLEKCEKHFDEILKGQGLQTVLKQTSYADRRIEDIKSLPDMMDYLDEMTQERLSKLETGVREAMLLAEKAASIIAC